MNDKFTFGSAGLVHELEMGMERAGGWNPALVKLLTSGDHLVRVREYLQGRAQFVPVQEESPLIGSAGNQLTVSVDLGFEDRITRGQYGWRNSDLTEKRFPVAAEQVGDWEWKLFHFDRDIESVEAIRLMKEDGYDAGQIGHILAFGEKYPEEQRKFPIIGLGSVAKVYLNRYVPELWRVDGRRELRLYWFDRGWRRHFRFLGVRRRSVA